MNGGALYQTSAAAFGAVTGALSAYGNDAHARYPAAGAHVGERRISTQPGSPHRLPRTSGFAQIPLKN
jgi:hypothetical protein